MGCAVKLGISPEGETQSESQTMWSPRPALAGGRGDSGDRDKIGPMNVPGRLAPFFKPTPWEHSHTCHRWPARARCPPAHRLGTQVSWHRCTGSRNDNTRPPWRNVFHFGGGDATRHTKVHPVSRFKKSLLGHSIHDILNDVKSRVGAMGNLDSVGGRQLSPPLLAF